MSRPIHKILNNKWKLKPINNKRHVIHIIFNKNAC